MDSFKSAMKKFFRPAIPGGKVNPYANPQNPNRNPPQAPPATTITNAFKGPASPRGSRDYLAEAREAVGRDRVTGKKKAAVSSSAHGESSDSKVRNVRGGGGARNGTRYDLFVQEMKERKAGNYAQPTEYYAPPAKPMTEYYAPDARR
ncbi:hypothetical protein K469DRAFT_685031 [Zopfia rhizophila CBS 207.26]|uniref:Uncharacterized protein n=1 Tax=Zopfia rhizophila CBS 207.26 TaxID=1314779 RepID=A0A6A6ECN9_9PEZI|nr:hypothetical protein K469DRAFT_685031 [Zopfia rhizophila CBS 207.26]